MKAESQKTRLLDTINPLKKSFKGYCIEKMIIFLWLKVLCKKYFLVAGKELRKKKLMMNLETINSEIKISKY